MQTDRFAPEDIILGVSTLTSDEKNMVEKTGN